jgi:hypothetical protein
MKNVGRGSKSRDANQKTTGAYPPVLKHVGNRPKFSFKCIKVVDFFQHTMLGYHRV